MLKRLSIQNYAIIDKLEISFSEKLNIITGETGAGKSILMGALSLILGDRADTNVLMNREKKCFVEGVFLTGNQKGIREFLKENDFDVEDELVIRREIAANGKSRAFINDTPVNLEQLRQLSSKLVDLHRQFDTLELGEADFQREVLDALAGQGELLTNYHQQFTAWQQAFSDWQDLQKQKDQFAREYDYNQFLFTELEELGLKENELEEADVELKLLSNSENIKAALDKSVFILSEGEEPLIQQLKTVSNQLQPFGGYHTDLAALLPRIASLHIELKDIAAELERINDHMGFDPARMEWLNNRLAAGYKLMKKHGVNHSNDLLRIQAELEEKLQAVMNIDGMIAAAQQKAEQAHTKAKEMAALISQNRKQQVKPLQDKVNKLLVQVGMPNARLQVQVQEAPLSASGCDRVEFLFDANKSNRFEPVSKVASGGELSRLMLCIKSLVAQSLNLATLIFDEIDTGISGEAARQVGMIMKDLAKKRQVISITHQPQIAGRADAHFFVYKEIIEEAVHTNIRQLSQEERITAIAKMLSGEKPTAAALQNAREMLMN